MSVIFNFTDYHPVWKAIETEGHVIDVIKIIKELDKAGYYITSKETIKQLSGVDVQMTAQYKE